MASQTGVPIMRPLLLEFPEEGRAWDVEDEFMLGPDLLVAPVLERGARSRSVYLPAGAEWSDAWTGARAPSGSEVVADAPLERIPLYLRNGAKLPIADG